LAVTNRIRSAWNAFINNVAQPNFELNNVTYGSMSYGDMSPSRPKTRYSTEPSIISSIYTRMGIDVSAVAYRHIKVDENGKYQDDVKSNLNDCLTKEPNIDQGPRAFRQDIATTLFDKGVAAIVPVDTSMDPKTKEILDIYTLRVGEIVNWYPKHVKISVYNELTGTRQEITLEKRFVAIVENPLYAVMNQPNSTLQRLIRKLNLMDVVDDQVSSGKLDLIIQLPYVIKSEARRAQAEQRRSDIELQLKDSQYGIAYTDGTEKITQLNRPVENKLLGQIEYLTDTLYSQLGLTTEVMNGTANEATMLNYYNRSLEPIIDAIVEAMQRSFIGPISTRNNEKIEYFNDAFKLVPVAQLAELADKFTRNEILSANEVRDIIGFVPSKDPKADELRNSNIPDPNPAVPTQTVTSNSTNGAKPATAVQTGG
jgi:Phage portal protein